MIFKNVIRLLLSLLAVVLLQSANVMYAQQYRVHVDVLHQESILLSNVLSSFSFEEISSDELVKMQDMTNQKELSTYLPSVVNEGRGLSNPLGGSYYINKIIEKGDTVIIHYVPSQTIYFVNKRTREQTPWITIDFGEQGYKDNILQLNSSMYKKYVKSHYQYAGYIENVAFFDNVLFFTYRYNDEIVQVLYNMTTNHCLNGKIVDDLFAYFPDTRLFNQSASKFDRGIDFGYLSTFNLSNTKIKELFPDVDTNSIKSQNSNHTNRVVLIPTFKNF